MQPVSIVTQLEQKRDHARQGGGQKRIDSQHDRGKLTARERLEVLLEFQELTNSKPFNWGIRGSCASTLSLEVTEIESVRVSPIPMSLRSTVA